MSLAEVVLATIELVALHKLDGRVVFVNPDAVVQLAEPKPEGAAHKAFTDDVNCVVGLTDGRYVTVRETCPEVRKLFVEQQRRN